MIRRATSARFVQIGNTNTLDPITCKGVQVRYLSCAGKADLAIPDMFEFTTLTKTKTTQCCAKSLLNGQTGQIGVDEGEEPRPRVAPTAIYIF